MRKFFIEVAEEELDQLTPQGREAVLRLARQQNPDFFKNDSATPNERLRSGMKPGPTAEEHATRVAQFQNPDGSIKERCTLKPPAR